MEHDIVAHKFRTAGIIPVVTIPAKRYAVPLSDALLEGGLPVAEITLRTADALRSLESIAKGRPELLLGAGTVITVKQAKEAVDAGARFIVSPGLVPQVVDWCLENKVPVFPGICTPTEIAQAINLGIRDLKFFPSSLLGGLKAVMTLLSVFPDIRLMPTGGISAENVTGYLKTSGVLCCGGSYIAPKQFLLEENYTAITRLAKEAVALVQQTRTNPIPSTEQKQI